MVEEQDAPKAGCLGQFLALLLPRAGETGSESLQEVPHVTVNKHFVTVAERSFFHVLSDLVGSRGYILTQVALNRLLYFPGQERSNPGRQRWRSIVNARSIDFVVVDPSTFRPFLAIELDDGSHASVDRQVRDANVERILDAAGLPLLRIRAASAYDTRVLLRQLEPYLPPTQPGSPPPPAPQPAATRPAAAQPAPPPRPPSPPKA